MAKISDIVAWPGHDARRPLAKMRHALLLASPLALAGCVSSTDGFVTTAAIPDDYREMHAIALVNQPDTLDVFVAGEPGVIDHRSADQIREFAARARSKALGGISILVPQGTGHDRLTLAAVPAIKRLLAEGGAHQYAAVGSYPVADPTLASPIRLSFLTVKARVASQCGQWPRDLASGSSLYGWENRHYWNYGCATQNNFAAQVADPRDLVAAQAEQPADIQMRMRAIGLVRGTPGFQNGQDPGTKWGVTFQGTGELGKTGSGPQ